MSLQLGGLRIQKLAKAWRFFGPHARAGARWMAGALGCGVGAVLMQLLRPWPLKLVFDEILIPGPAAAGPFSEALGALSEGQLLAAICVALLAISGLWGLFAFGQAYLTARAGHSVVFDLRFQTHAHLQRLSLNFHRGRQKGDLLMRLTGDINVLRDLLVDSLIQGVASILLLFTMLTVLFLMDWRLALVVTALLPVLALTTFRFSAKIRNAAQRQRKKEGRVAAAISETLDGIPLIQAFGRAELRDRSFRLVNRRGLRAGLRTTRLEASMTRIIELLLAAGTAAVFWYGVRRVQAGALTPGDLLVFISYVHSSFKPLRRLARVSSRAAKATVCADRVRAVLRTAPEVRSQPGAKLAKAIVGAVEFRRVSFAYPDKRRALHRVGLRIEAGSFVGVVGPSGSGKSTLLALLLRLYDPRRGRIRIDGKDLRRYRVGSIRRQMSVLLQDPFLFGDTIRNNIAFGRPEATQDEILRAIEAAQAKEFVDDLPEGLDTSLAEAGASLSAGQRQRIAIARAFLRNSPILLLDEPTTGLDAISEVKVMSGLIRLMGGKTTLMVAHKLCSVQAADQIVVLRRGRVLELGTHDELVRSGGWYARTWRTQDGETRSAEILSYPALGRAVAKGG